MASTHSAHSTHSSSRSDSGSESVQRLRMAGGWLAVGVGIVLFAGKFVAYALTGSSAVFSDAMESTVNIVAAALLVVSLTLAAKPPDTHHPYGHGKVEFLSAGLEGAAISAAALIIVAEGMRELIQGPELRRLGLGALILGVCTLANAVLGATLVRIGRRTQSIALEADGRHLMTDVWTSVGVIGGLGVVKVTGWAVADPLIAIAVALNVTREGFSLLRRAFDGLMDHQQPEVLEFAAEALSREREAGWIDVHELRSWRSGARPHFDLHVTVPRYFDVETLHRIHDRVELALLGDDPHGGDVVVHFDPCTPAHCSHCRVLDCPVRESPFREPLPTTPVVITRTDEEAAADVGSVR